MKILVTGLPGSGKSTFSNKLFEVIDNLQLPVIYYNGDDLRSKFGDWDFSEKGRIRQLERMCRYAEACEQLGYIVICDFICPKNSYRKKFDADIVIWMDTIKEGRYEDTNKLFETPDKYDVHVVTYEDIYLNMVMDLIDAKRHICDR
jgi:adenylylsulfate kinase